MKISILIPTKDEPYAKELVNQIHRSLRQSHEIIVIDKSKTIPKVGKAKVIRQRSSGLGNAVVEGLKHLKGNIIVVMDGDGSHRPADISKLISGLKNSDVVIGSRFVKGARTLDVAHGKIVSLGVRKFTEMILNLEIKDNMSGFAAIKREVLDNIKLNPLGYKIVLEIAYKAKKEGFKIKEVPIVFLPRSAGESKVGAGELLRIIRLVVGLKLRIR